LQEDKLLSARRQQEERQILTKVAKFCVERLQNSESDSVVEDSTG
jgi:hypothetical protein